VQIWAGQRRMLKGESHTEQVSSFARSIPVWAWSSDIFTAWATADEKSVAAVDLMIGLAAAQR
jgi:hypothetical protein